MRVAELEAEVLSPKDVIVIHSPDDGSEWWDSAADTLLAGLATRTGCHVIVLLPGGAIETLTDSQMREHGWVRVRQWQRLVDARARLVRRTMGSYGGDLQDAEREFIRTATEVLDEIETAR
jgi:hypothetical protein